jgi:VIT1/CCC1 family predicted Fe2+/Mn2+ transporter
MRAEIAVERRELARNPHGEQAELAALYRARGLDADLAQRVAEGLSADPEQALRVHVREELGVDPDDLPSPLLAAGSSFLAFAAGALVPLTPFLFGASGLLTALVLSVLALFGTGAAVARMTARPWWLGGLRQLVLGVGAAAVTFGLGHLLGVAVS